MTGYGLEYILDSLTLDIVMMIYDYGLGFEETKSIILINTYAQALNGKKSKQIDIDKPPPKYDQLKSIFGDRVKPIVKE